MATPAQLLANVAAAVEAEVTGIQRLGSDYRDDLEAIPAGATRYQLRGGPAGVDYDSNEAHTAEAVVLAIHHRLANPTAERTYTEGAMQSDVEAIIAPSFWRALASAYEVLSAPTYRVARELNVISVTIETTVSVA